MTTLIVCLSSSRLTDEHLNPLSTTFPHQARMQFIEMLRVMGDTNLPFRSYEAGTVTFDREQLLQTIAFRISPKAAQRLASLLDQGVCPQALASTRLKVPMEPGSKISLRGAR